MITTTNIIKETGYLYAAEWNPLFPHIMLKIKYTWIEDFIVRWGIIKVLGVNVEKTYRVGTPLSESPGCDQATEKKRQTRFYQTSKLQCSQEHCEETR